MCPFPHPVAFETSGPADGSSATSMLPTRLEYCLLPAFGELDTLSSEVI